MTQTFDELVDPENPSTEIKRYPTNWYYITDGDDVKTEVEARSLDEHRYEIRSATHLITVNKEGFRLFKDDSLQGHVLFTDWCQRNSVRPIPRKDIENGLASE